MLKPQFFVLITIATMVYQSVPSNRTSFVWRWLERRSRSEFVIGGVIVGRIGLRGNGCAFIGLGRMFGVCLDQSLSLTRVLCLGGLV